MPEAVSPSTSARSSAGELRRPSRPTAIRLPSFSATIEPKLRPMACASASCSVWPTTPRMSYSRKIVGSKTWPSAVRITDRTSRVVLDDLFDRRAQLRPHQGESEIGFEEAYLVAAIEPPAGEPQAVKGLLGGNQLCQRVSELDLATGA